MAESGRHHRRCQRSARATPSRSAPAGFRLGGIDAPSVDQLCLSPKGERWTCGVAARDELIQARRQQALDLPRAPARRPPRPGRGALRCRRRGHPEMDGRQRLGAVLCAGFPTITTPTRRPRARPRRGCGKAPSSRRGTGASATRRRPSSAPPSPPPNAHAILLASASGSVAPSPDCTIKGNVNSSGECIYHKPTSRWYARSRCRYRRARAGFCSVEDAEAAGCRETRRWAAPGSAISLHRTRRRRSV